jgi:hypothetical protein
MLFIGDVHGKLDEYEAILKEHRFKESGQWELSYALGDMGIGFPKHPDITKGYERVHTYEHPNATTLTHASLPHYFIRGNHDNPEVCQTTTGYLGEYGFKSPAWGANLFFVSGAASIDREFRTEGVSWWEGEELPYQILTECLDTWKGFADRIEVVISHTCPKFVLEEVFHTHARPSRTEHMLQGMWETRGKRLAYWVFGHLHRSYRRRVNGVWFIGLDELEHITLDDLHTAYV